MEKCRGRAGAAERAVVASLQGQRSERERGRTEAAALEGKTEEGASVERWLLKNRRSSSWEPSHHSVADVAWLDVLPYREEENKGVGGGLR
jgi:hypothetical protein